MIITKIERQKNNEKRFSIFIDGEFSFGISDVDVLYYKLKEGDELSEEKYENIIENAIYSKAKDTAFNYIGYKPRTEKEVLDKLESKEFGCDIINRVVEMLKSYGYIDDYKYAAQYIAERTRQLGDGRIKLEFELRERGVKNDIISQVLDEASLDETESALRHIEKKLKGAAELDSSEKKRLYGYLIRRGFSYDTIQAAFSKYFSLFN